MLGNQKSVVFFGLLAVLASVLTWIIVSFHFNSEFRVIYSLDKRQNDQEIVQLIDRSQHYDYFAIYDFTENDIADALIRAKRRGLIVQGITDTTESTSTNAKVVARLAAAGIYLETQKHLDGIMHIKALVTDQAYASGSYNWTESATEDNDEVLEIGTNSSVRRQYLAILKKLLALNE